MNNIVWKNPKQNIHTKDGCPQSLRLQHSSLRVWTMAQAGGTTRHTPSAKLAPYRHYQVIWPLDETDVLGRVGIQSISQTALLLLAWHAHLIQTELSHDGPALLRAGYRQEGTWTSTPTLQGRLCKRSQISVHGCRKIWGADQGPTHVDTA